MSDVMMFGIAQMPYEMAMGDELSRLQFYTNTQRLVAEHEALLRRVAALRDAGSALANIAYNLAQYDVPAPEREILDAARRRWDVAMKGEGQRVRILAEPGEVGS